MRALSLTIGQCSQNVTKCDQDDVLEADFIANSMLLLRFVTCVAIAFAFCVFVAGAAFGDVAKVLFS